MLRRRKGVVRKQSDGWILEDYILVPIEFTEHNNQMKRKDTLH